MLDMMITKIIVFPVKSKEEKESFYKKCTDEYTKKQLKNIEEIRIWLKNLLITKK